MLCLNFFIGGIKMNKELAIKTEQEKVIELMSQILDFNQEIEVEIKNIIKGIGIRKFFFEIDSLNLSDEIKGKVNVLKEIIQNIDENVQSVDFAKDGDVYDK